MDIASLIITGSLGASAAGVLYLIARKSPAGREDDACLLPPPGWACTRTPGHAGPCAAVEVSPPWWMAEPEPANTNLPALDAEQTAVLHAMSAIYGHTANDIMERTGLPHVKVAGARRYLREIGLAHYGPLYDEDGAGIRGSGYTLTDEGVRVAAALAGLAVAA